MLVPHRTVPAAARRVARTDPGPDTVTVSGAGPPKSRARRRGRGFRDALRRWRHLAEREKRHRLFRHGHCTGQPWPCRADPRLTPRDPADPHRRLNREARRRAGAVRSRRRLPQVAPRDAYKRGRVRGAPRIARSHRPACAACRRPAQGRCSGQSRRDADLGTPRRHALTIHGHSSFEVDAPIRRSPAPPSGGEERPGTTHGPTAHVGPPRG